MGINIEDGMRIMEEKWILPTPDDHMIYGIKNYSANDLRRAIFMVHGFSSSMYDYAFKRAADVLSAKYDVYRFNLYDGQSGGRALLNCTLQTHADDLNIILQRFSPAYDKTFLIGHSYGGPSVMLVRPATITAASLWDPSWDLRNIQTLFSDNIEIRDEFVINHWGVATLMGKAMHTETSQMDAAACATLAREFGHPIQVIHAGDGFFADTPESYHSYGDAQNVREIVAGTTHCFYEGNSCEDLLAKTAAWFERF